MALITAGSIVGQVSGRIGSVIFSHNRGGPYARNGVIPVSSQSTYSLAVKAAFAAASQAWRNLTEDQRQAWSTWAQTNPVMNRLGSSTILQGNAAFVQINARLSALAVAMLDDPPVTNAPDALITLVGSFDIGLGTFDLAFTATPLGATERLYVFAALVSSPSINYVKNLMKLIVVSTAAQASPLDIETELSDRFGTLIVGQKVIVTAAVLDTATGLLSARRIVDGLIVST